MKTTGSLKLDDIYFKFPIWLCSVILLGLCGLGLWSGLGTMFDIVICIAAGLIGIKTITESLSWLSCKVMRYQWPRFNVCIALCIVYYVTLNQLFLGEVFIKIILTAILVVIAVFSGIALDRTVTSGPGSRSGLLWGVPLLFIWCYLIFWVASPGWQEIPAFDLAEQEVLVLDMDYWHADDPSVYGNFAYTKFNYGSGQDKHREFYAEGADWISQRVDGSQWVSDWKWPRTWFWGFDEKAMPINGRLWMPEGSGPYPLVMIVHGNHAAEDFSDGGYDYLGELFASRGYIAVSVDQNFLNSSWSGSLDGDMDARAKVLIEHLKQIKAWSTLPDHPLFQKADLSRVALIGHSRGGEAIVQAASELNHTDDGIRIFALAAIAPTDMHHSGSKHLSAVNYFVMHGSLDGDVSAFKGQRQYDRISFAGETGTYFKSALYIQNANHSQFNTSWGTNDIEWPVGLLLNRSAAMDGDEQRRIAKVYLSSFLDISLKEERHYLEMFRDYRYALKWLPETHYINQYEDSHSLELVTFDEQSEGEDIKLKGRHIDEMKIVKVMHRDGFSMYKEALQLAWDQKGAYFSILYEKPEDLTVKDNSDDHALYFSMADASGDDKCTEIDPARCLDFTVTLTDADKESVSFIASKEFPVAPAIHSQYTKANFLETYLKEGRYELSSEPVFQTYRIPVNRMLEQNEYFDPENVKEFRLVFHRQQEGEVLLDHLGVDWEEPSAHLVQ